MHIKELDVVLLKDGRKATVLECYDDSTAFYVEVSDESGKATDMFIAKLDDIEQIIYSA